MTQLRPTPVGCQYCDDCEAPASVWKPRLAGKSQSRCPTCGAPKSQWRKLVEVDRMLPVQLCNGGVGGNNTKARRVDVADDEAVKAKRMAALQRAIDTANGDKWLVVWEARMEARKQRYVKPQQPLPPKEKSVRKYAPSVSELAAAEAAWQRSYDARRDAERRLGLLNVPANDCIPDPRNQGSHELKAERIHRVEMSHNPRAELLDAARAGDEVAAARADGLFENWRQSGVMRRLG